MVKGHLNASVPLTDWVTAKAGRPLQVFPHVTRTKMDPGEPQGAGGTANAAGDGGLALVLPLPRLWPWTKDLTCQCLSVFTCKGGEHTSLPQVMIT